MPKVYDFWKDKFNLPTIILVIAAIIGIIHIFSYLIPFTDDAFVVTNVEPVAADTSGYITAIYVKNGQKVHHGEPLFKVFDEPYKLAYVKAQANYDEALANIDVITAETQKNKDNLAAAIDDLNKTKYEYSLKSKPIVSHSVSQLEIQTLNYMIQSQINKVNSLKKQLIIDDKLTT